MARQYGLYEFFAGGGMAKIGLGERWNVLRANDIDVAKARSYRENHGGEDFIIANVSALNTTDLPGNADLAWASFPCQDLSLAGNRGGLNASRSGTFWPFWKLIKDLGCEGRRPRLVVLENVAGALTSHGGADFAAVAEALVSEGYRLGAVVIDAARFVPQSRPRLFVIAVGRDLMVPEWCQGKSRNWHPESVIRALGALTPTAREAWIWWNLPCPPDRRITLEALLELDNPNITWDAPEKTAHLLSLMTGANRAKVTAAGHAGVLTVGTVYRRTRQDSLGSRSQRAEVRFDGIAGCLRTPAGGSSRQTIMIVEGERIRTRLLTTREAARLMGLPDTYRLPSNYNAAYQLVGDGLAVPVVRFLADHLLEPVLDAQTGSPTHE